MSTELLYCSACNEQLESGWDICPSCETPTGSASGLTCTTCGRAIKSGWKKCPYCKAATTTGTRDSNAPAISSDAAAGVFLTNVAGAAEQATLANIIPAGAQLDKYRIKSSLGTGGFGAVFLAEDTTLKEDIALKVVRVGESHSSERALNALLQEFRVRSRIRDTTHIVMGQDPRPVQFNGLALLLLPMELASGGTFRAWLRRPGRPVPDRLREGIQRFREICRGVAAIHDAELVHLDLKPENVLLTDAGAKIADFGLGRFAGATQTNQPEDQLLREGIGTPQYMSPEQFAIARQKDIGPTSDVYSLGVMLYELLDGDLPFDGMNVAELREKHLHSAPTPFKDPTLRETWWRVVARCLQKSPDTRYQSAALLLKDFERALLGAAFVVDVSCPSCAHINANPNARSCERCSSDLGTLFQACPRCGKLVRKDVERCVGCGADVAGYYLAIELNRQVSALQDEDVEEAIAILEQLVQRVSSDETLSWLKGLRHKQDEIVSCIDAAQRETAKGEAEAAVKEWRRVLRIAPRHRYALAQIARLDGLRDTYSQSVREAMAAADAAEFESAIEKLNAALPVLPQREEGRKLLLEIQGRSQHYEKAMEETRQAAATKMRRSQKHFAERALAEASKSVAAKTLREEAVRATTEADRQVERGRTSMRAALWDDATALLTGVGTLSADHVEAATTLLRELGHAQGQYGPLLASGRAAAAERRIGTVADIASQLLALAPDDKVSRQLSDEARESKARVEACLEATKPAAATADFAVAYRSLDAARDVWADHPPIAHRRSEIDVLRQGFEAAIAEGRGRMKARSPRAAVESFDRAKGLCPKAPEPKSELAAAKDAVARAEKLGNEANLAARSAMFPNATQLGQSAQALDQSEAVSAALAGRLKGLQAEYEGGLKTARAQLTEGRLDEAQSIVTGLQEFFTHAADLKGLLREIAEARARMAAAAEKAAQEARDRQATFVKLSKIGGLAAIVAIVAFFVNSQFGVNNAVNRALRQNDVVAAASTIDEKGGASKLSSATAASYAAAADSWMSTTLTQWYQSATIPVGGWAGAELVSRHAATLGVQSDREARHRYFVGQVNFDNRRWNDAEREYRAALSGSSDQSLRALSQNGIGKACWRANRIACSIESYLGAIAIAPGWLYPMQNVAGVFLNAGRFGEAERYYAAVLQLDGNRGGSRFGLGEVYYNQRRYRAAREQYEIALRSNGLDPAAATEARSRLAWLSRRGY